MTNFILDHWNTQAEKYGTSHEASWGDLHAIKLEIDVIGKFIKKGDSILDVGCANGYATVYQTERHPKKIIGIDNSPKMIEQARKNIHDKKSKCEIEFQVGSVLDIPFEKNQFDVVYTTRTLINLPTWEEQKQGILECIRVCKIGGTIVLSEAFLEPLVLLNSMRTLKSLPPLVEHDFNRYLKKEWLEKLLKSLGMNFEVIDFSSIYYLGSRFVRELVTNPEDYPGYANPINEIFYNIEKEYSGGGFGIQQAYAMRKDEKDR
jgi:ubiquinone/menaquinone biosynthesis C-methylase UbiE